MELRDIIESGIWRERASQIFYLKLSKRAKGDLKLLLEYMSRDEESHEKFLTDLYKKIYNTDPPEIPMEGEMAVEGVDVKSIDELIDVGIAKERESKYYYMDLFCRLENLEDREKVVELINFEESHLKKLLSAKEG